MTLAAYLSVSFSFMDLYMYSDAQTFFFSHKSSLEKFQYFVSSHVIFYFILCFYVSQKQEKMISYWKSIVISLRTEKMHLQIDLK